MTEGRPALARDLMRLSGGAVTADADLRQYGRWRTGGRAWLVVEPSSAEGVRATLSYLADTDLPRLVIGDGSNVLFDDQGFDGVLVRIGPSLSALRFNGLEVTAEAGIWVPRFVRLLGQRGLKGLEHAIGIPGTLGGLVMMNGGSRRQGVGSSTVNVRGCDMRGAPFTRSRAECAFRYRGSTLQDDGLIVLETDFRFEAAERGALRREMISIMGERRRKFPKAQPNCGSVFLSDPRMYEVIGPPGAAIERAGLKGRRIGGAQSSPLHANFIVNLGDARSDDILSLIHLIRTTVHDQTGFWMDAEVRHIAPDGRVRPAHEAAAAHAAPQTA
ncbi:UDP-N-acetylmuramate dehydrogenase [Brevundimonas balnearis]|uniref:UDP-N-acetylenolpyruvoylglucosamine reductase n=1 Tax=Brevundimonas balnearis TaxID=1572858 RepID=A0ABV6R1D2_9CAUL